MHPFQELLAHVGFTRADSAALQELWPAVEARRSAIVERFYDVVLRFEGAARALHDAGSLETLKQTLSAWIEMLCVGPHDDAYPDRRANIGHEHARSGLEHCSLLAGMNALRGELLAVIDEGESELAAARRGALLRITDVELALIAGAFVEHVRNETLEEERRRLHARQASTMASLVSNIAHEIRNPLAGISGSVQVVASSLPLDDERREALDRVQEQIIRLGDVVGDLLAFSEPMDAADDLVDLVDLHPIVAAAARQVDAALGQRTTVTGRGGALADTKLLSQAVYNLVENAWQAGAHTVSVLIDGHDIRVVDDGPGLAPDVAERAFEPFFTTKVRGTGLGLPIARKMIEAMGGTLGPCASPLRGAGFQIQLRPARTA